MKVTNHYLPNVVMLDIPTESRIYPATVNLNPGVEVYGERLFKDAGVEYRTWDPYRSKLSACIMEDMQGIPNLGPMRILYLGASTGTTVSHVSDIVGRNGGKIYAVEFSIRPARRLIQLSQQRRNVLPIVVDARFPDRYASQVFQADFIFQDISQSNQSEIFVDNLAVFLRPKGRAILIIKIKSIDAIAPDEDVVNNQIEFLEKADLKILEHLDISKYEKAHRGVLVEKQ